MRFVDEGNMDYEVSRVDVAVRRLAAVRRIVERDRLGEQVPVCLGQVWQFLRATNITDVGHNVVLYDGRSGRSSPGALDCTFGVEVVGAFRPVQPVVEAATPAGPAVTTAHWGPYTELGDANRAILAWCAERSLTLSGLSWEVYGDWSDDPSKLRTDVFYGLASTR